MILTLARKFIGSTILAVDKITSPKPPTRSPEQQAALDEKTCKLVLYEMLACPYCVKVRREIKRQGLNIQRLDVKRSADGMESLINGGGKFQVPCLRVDNGKSSQWLYESDDIIEYLRTL